MEFDEQKSLIPLSHGSQFHSLAAESKASDNSQVSFYLKRQDENMDERYIFNATQNEYAGTIHKMADLALQEGYKFILFNDRVYCVSEDIIINTGLTRNDILQHS